METMDVNKKLDVTQIEPRLKHPTIFDWFHQLKGGDYFVIHNDHDPKPLYFQLKAEEGDVFEWEYLMEGPEVWEVKITKKVIEQKEPTIGELVAEDYRKAEVFRKYGIDFCCGGEKPVKAACEKNGINYEDVMRDMEELDKNPEAKMDKFNDWELDFLSDYIVNNHHRYVRDNVPALLEYTSKVAQVHGPSHPEVIDIAHCFRNVADQLLSHMVKEESVLFPYIKKMVAAEKSGEKIEKPSFETIKNPIREMDAEHEEAGDDMERIRQLSDNYTLPADACNTYSVMFAKLEEFEKDLHRHIHLENNILFGKSIRLEKEVIA